MSGHPVYSAIADMEMAVCDVKRWGQVVSALGAGGEVVEAEALFVVGQAIERLGESAHAKWKAAHAAVVEAKGCA